MTRKNIFLIIYPSSVSKAIDKHWGNNLCPVSYNMMWYDRPVYDILGYDII